MPKNKHRARNTSKAFCPQCDDSLHDAPIYYDVVIIGGGPAGCAAALSLLQEPCGLKVAVLERSTSAQIRPGKMLAAAAQSLLQQLDIWQSFLGVGYPRASAISSTWGTECLSDECKAFGSWCAGWQLDRRCFDRFLADQARQRGAHIYTGASLQEARLDDGVWHLNLRKAQNDSEILAVRAGFVIDASGREAVFAARRGVRPITLDQMVGSFVLFSFGNKDLDRSGTPDGPLIESCENGLWYSSYTSDNSEMVVVCFTDADLADQLHLDEPACWATMLGETLYTRDRMRDHVSKTNPVLFPAHSQRLERIYGERWLAAGDAAASCDPIAWHGLSRAICSGLLAASAACDFYLGNPVGLKKYEELITNEYKDYLLARLELYRRELRWTNAPFWTRRQLNVVLHPERVVSLQQRKPNLYQFADLHLSLRELGLLCKICDRQLPARDVVAAFRAKAKTLASDATVMAALQHLVDVGVLTCAA